MVRRTFLKSCRRLWIFAKEFPKLGVLEKANGPGCAGLLADKESLFKSQLLAPPLWISGVSDENSVVESALETTMEIVAPSVLLPQGPGQIGLAQATLPLFDLSHALTGRSLPRKSAGLVDSAGRARGVSPSPPALEPVDPDDRPASLAQPGSSSRPSVQSPGQCAGARDDESENIPVVQALNTYGQEKAPFVGLSFSEDPQIQCSVVEALQNASQIQFLELATSSDRGGGRLVQPSGSSQSIEKSKLESQVW